MFDLTPFDFGNRFFASYNPFKEMEEMERRFFGSRTTVFHTDIRETEQAYILETDLPGFSKEDIHAKIQNGYLTIRASRETKSENKDEQNHYLRRERSYGSFERSFDLTGIQSDKISAEYRDGVLTLTLPKEIQKTDEGRQLEIH